MAHSSILLLPQICPFSARTPSAILKPSAIMNPDFVRVDLRNSIWEIPSRYENLQILGSGAYGLVCSSHDKSRQMHVAIKKISNPFQTPIHAKRTYREIKLLKHMQHENVSKTSSSKLGSNVSGHSGALVVIGATVALIARNSH